jgi:chromosome segregation ATPase
MSIKQNKELEIERLRGELHSVHMHLRHMREQKGHLHAEIERLQAERAGDQQRLFHYESEIERLRTDKDKQRLQFMERIALLEAQNARLRSALDGTLEEFINFPDNENSAVDEARRVLKQETP